MDNKTDFKYAVLVIVCLCGLNSVYAQYQMSPLALQIMEHFQITQTQYASLFTSSMLPAVILGIPFGFLADRIGIKRIMAGFLIIASAGLWLRAFTTSYALFYAGLLVMGLPATFMNVSHAKVMSVWFGSKWSGIAIGIYTAMSTLGMAIALGTTAFFPSAQIAFVAAAVICSAVTCLWIVFMRDYPKTLCNTEKIPFEKKSIPFSIKCILRSRNIVLACVCIFIVFGVNMVYSSFLPIILQGKGMSQIGAGLAASVFMVGNLAGCLIAPVLAKQFAKIRLVLFVSAVLVCIFSFMEIPSTGNILYLFLFIAGSGLGGMIPLLVSFSIRDPRINLELTSTTCSIIATFQLSGAVFLPRYFVLPFSGGRTDGIIIVNAVLMALCAIMTMFMTSEIETGT